ncbi:histidine kinase [Riemerella anatipestifer]|uniref:sensor histidine kinase n=1 Tax=Riemerella anatipestifer TaxID=34085 RepID=UPI001AD712F3|nr:histidine kinase [Riemerella anatipestifer]MBO4233466.1 histidine kinase [Riemerella anatipestifer]
MKTFSFKNIRTLFIVSVLSALFFFLFATPEKTIHNFFISWAISLLYTFGFGITNGLLNEFLDKKYNWTTQLKLRLFGGIIGVIINIILVYGFNYFHFVIIRGIPTEDYFSAKSHSVNLFMIIFVLLISSILHAYGFMKALQQSTQEKIEVQEQLAKASEAQFQSLKTQLDPHFLFNSLNVLTALIEENPPKAQKFTEDMSKIYRYVLEQRDKKTVSVAEEISFAKTYAELLKTRFEDSVNFSFDINPNFENHLVVPLSLQLLLENVIKHNFATIQKPLNIKVYTSSSYLMVENNLQAREMPAGSTGVGLKNIQQRYALLTHKEVNIVKNETIFRVEIPLI